VSPGQAKGSAKRRGEDEDEVQPIEGGGERKKSKLKDAGEARGGAPDPWNFIKNPSVTEVTAVRTGPLRVELMARPAGQGKHTPVPCVATEDKLIELDSLSKADKIEQQKRRRILEKLTNALIEFGLTNELPAALKAALVKTAWGADVLTKLVFTVQAL
jgi:hypothetical protein